MACLLWVVPADEGKRLQTAAGAGLFPMGASVRYPMVYLALFVSAFLSATLLPGTSEAVLAASLHVENVSLALLVAAATLGNVLGSVLNWGIGVLVVRGSRRLKLPVSQQALDRYQSFYNRYGAWSLLLAWVPIIGDPLTVLAGLARTPLMIFLPLVTLGKLFRYLVVAGVVEAAF